MPDQPIDIVELFCSYSHKDEEWKDKLATHLSVLRRQQLIALWTDRKIQPGDEWQGQIDEHLDSAQIILLLISADFIASNYCYDVEMKRALERNDRHEARVIPISVRPVVWTGLPFARFQALPQNAKAIATWGNEDEAFVDVTNGIYEVVVQIKSSTKAPPTPGVVFRTGLTEPLGQWTLTLNVASTQVDGKILKTILDSLRQVTGKAKLVLQQMEGDPATLVFSSTRRVFDKIHAQTNQIPLPIGIRFEKIEWQSEVRQAGIVR